MSLTGVQIHKDMLSYSPMGRKVHLKNLPNLSLLSGYVFILAVMVMFGTVQFASTRNLNDIDSGLRILTLNISDSKNDADFQRLLIQYREFINTDLFSRLQSTFQLEGKTPAVPDIRDIEDLKEQIAAIGNVLDSREADLYRSQAILLTTFIGLSIILSILLTVSEFDQLKKLEHEKSQRLSDQKLMDVLEEERNLIAVELHDEVAQKLSILNQHFESPFIIISPYT